ncbi:high-affinity iron transporter [Methanohalophilus levihalophilus]|uniref:FTR1 family iron permease n=1 Tax=Methanohalophilus levihalophilus TaxID=1431282 RepID=UPI001AE30EF8|nr:FTR1 family protein [Methanohalophilus levihalophilus]MBP2029499.1 high-affinity iron transporter [Methanohalophilus levihalophilus]
MFTSFMITFREGLEAFLIIGIILAYLVQTGKLDLQKYVYSGAGVGIGLSAILAVLFNLLSIQFEGRNEEIFEGVVMLLAVAVITYVIVWMSREKHNIAANIEEKAKSTKAYGLFGLAFFSVFREGIETTLFLGAAATGTDGSQVLYGGLLGLGASLVLAYSVFKFSKHTHLSTFFNITTIFLILFAAGLAAHGVHELQEAGVIPIVIEHVWDMNNIIDENGLGGSILKSLFGYNGNPSLLEVFSYAGYYIALFAGLKGFGNRQEKVNYIEG